MNKFGKSNVLLIILIPVFLIATLIIVDTIISYGQKKVFKEVTESIMKSVLLNEDLDEDDFLYEIKRQYTTKGYDTNMLFVLYDNDKLLLENEHRYFGLLSSLTNKKGEKDTINIFGVEFNVRKGSKCSISVAAAVDENDEIIYEYSS